MNDLIFIIKESDYGESYKSHLLDQYKLYVESADKISERRQRANNYFLTINTLLTGIVGFLISTNGIENYGILVLLISMSGIGICTIWIRLLKAYKSMNESKFKIIHSIEKKLPLRLFQPEWNLLTKAEHEPFSNAEIMVARIFLGAYLIFTIWALMAIV